MPFFEKSGGVSVSGGSFVDASVNNYALDSGKGPGIELLLRVTLPQAIHNSYARDPSKCHPGTREEYIRDITGWGSGEWKTQQARALWVRGPAGVGKSAVAQTCAEGIDDSGKLGATFFFHRPNGWDDPKKFLPTIAYQLTTKYPAYRDLVDAIVLHDRLVLEKSIDVQFRELLVKPLRELSDKDQGVKMDAIIIVDGLDECKTKAAQGLIIELVTTSIHEQTSPFLWAFFSRPEPHIAAAFASEVAKKVSWQLTLPVSRDADSDIEAYLRDGFKKILAKYGLPSQMAWPSDEDIRCLVDQSSGLFVYATTVIRYIGQDTRVGHEAHLRAVLELGRRTTRLDSSPLSKLDQFYMLIMKQIPEAVLPNTLSLLYLRLHSSTYLRHRRSILYSCSALGLSLTAFHAATGDLHSVLDVAKSDGGMPTDFSFYHASFTDFLSDPARSGSEFCIDTPEIRQWCFTTIVNTVYHASINKVNILAWPDPEADAELVHARALWCLFVLAADRDVHLGEDILQQLSQFSWSRWTSDFNFSGGHIKEFVAKIPSNWRSKIIRPHHTGPLSVLLQALQRERARRREIYVIGRGSNKALLEPDQYGVYLLRPMDSTSPSV